MFAEKRGGPETPGEMDDLRAGIDAVDKEIVRLLDERARMARRIGEVKLAGGLEAYAPAREREVLDRVGTLSRGDFPKRGLEAVFREIISASISLEAPLKVAYLGPESTLDRKSTRLNSSHANISYAVFCLKKKKKNHYEKPLRN